MAQPDPTLAIRDVADGSLSHKLDKIIRRLGGRRAGSLPDPHAVILPMPRRHLSDEQERLL